MVVSYKKQVVLGILLLVILLGVVEVLVNIWLYNFYKCEFEDNEIFKNVDEETKRKICLENINIEYSEQKLSKVEKVQKLMQHNSEGFRGPEFEKNKPENTVRIFTIGGSTTFGAGVFDNQTIPFYLQQKFDEQNFDSNVEVINVGWPKQWSETETNLIKDRLIKYEPDLFIVYDGWNDFPRQPSNIIKWKERWQEVCELGEKQGFDTIVTLQPLVFTGKKILTDYESTILIKSKERFDDKKYLPYFEQLKKLQTFCTLTANLRNAFDYVKEPIFFDAGHVGPRGNQIIAEKFFQLSLPIVIENLKDIVSEKDTQKSPTEESNPQIISNEFDIFWVNFSHVFRDIISSYQTPKVFPLVFQQ